SAAVDERQLIAFCRERLGVRTPVRVLMVRELPRNPGGKVDKQRLLRHLTEGMRGAPRTPRP
ncbi:MAG: hypothetical protein JSW68_04795, partial [Burkholderiales bacterium]